MTKPGIEASLDALLEDLAERVAARLLPALAPRSPERVPLCDVTRFGAPSSRWVREHAPPGTVCGPRGRRWIARADFDTLLASTGARPRRVSAPTSAPPTSAPAVDAADVVDMLAARRARRAGAAR